MKNSKISGLLGMTGLMLLCSLSAYAEEEWYENLESSTIKYSSKSNGPVDRKSVESRLISETSDSRIAQNAWGASTQMMIKPAESG